MIEVSFYNPGAISDQKIEFSVISCRYQNQWLFCRKKMSDTWEIPGGHRETGETVEEAARRELMEETSATEFDLLPICPYSVNIDGEISYGMLFFAQIEKLGCLSTDSEVEEVNLFGKIPDALSYPEIHSRLFHGTQGWLNMQSNADELWDVYDKDRNLTGRLHRRGDFLNEGDYHLVVHVWLLNSKGEFLLTKRSSNKGFPGMWETPGGAALSGDDSLAAAIREIREETGLIANGKCAERIFTFRRDDNFADVWLFRQDFDLSDVRLLEGETVDKRYADKDTVQKLYDRGELVPYSYLKELFKKI